MAEHMNLAHWKKGSDNFEIVVEPNKAIQYRNTKKGEVRDVLVMPKIYSDAKKGMLASEQRLQALFNTTDPYEVAKHILLEGEVHLTAEYKQGLQDQKKKQIIQHIHRHGVDPRTHAPHPEQRIETALAEAKIRIDEFKPVDQQLPDIIKQLREILPIKFEEKQIALTIPAMYAPKAFPAMKSMGTIIRDAWLPDGSWSGTIQIPGGLEQELYDKLNGLMHGQLQAKVVQTL